MKNDKIKQIGERLVELSKEDDSKFKTNEIARMQYELGFCDDEEISLHEAISSGDKETVDKISKDAREGKIVRIM